MCRCALAVASLAGLFLLSISSVSAQENAPLLKYSFKAGKQYSFDVKIEATLENVDIIKAGVLSYSVSSVKDNQIVLYPSGNLGVQYKQKANEGGLPRWFSLFGLMGSVGIRGIGGPQGITINQQGELITSRELTPLPFLLGDMELLMIEALPAQAKISWEKQRELQVVENGNNSPLLLLASSPYQNYGKHTTAKEQINYSIIKQENNLAVISKKYSLTTSPEANQTSRFELTGDGQFTLDMTEGIIKEKSMKYECRLNEINISLKIPISINFHVLSAEEMAQKQKNDEEAREKLKKMQEPQALAPGELEKLLKDLKSPDTHVINTAADRLAKATVDSSNAATVSKALAKLLRHSDGWVQKSAANALTVWATPEAEDALIKAIQLEDVFVRGPAIKALGKLKSPKAAQAVASKMYEPNTRHDAIAALKAMGPVAEDATISLLKDRDSWVRAEACAVLQEIGGKKSLKALRALSGKSNGIEEMNCKRAISAIELRVDSDSDNDNEADSSKAENTGEEASSSAEGTGEFRTWRDASGKFSIEATLLSIEDGKAVLQKKDGKTTRVAIEKLSSSDKKYIKEHAEELKKAENPFE